MSDPTSEQGSGATATAAPPGEPPAPPRTSTMAPKPPRQHGNWAFWVALVVLIVLVAIALGAWWFLIRPSRVPASSGAQTSPYQSAMAKAGVKAPGQPIDPVDLSTIKYTGQHSFDATFTADELTALLNTFPHDIVIGNQPVSIRNAQFQPGPKSGELQLTATVVATGTSYQGTVQGVVAVKDGKLVAIGPLAVQAEGVDLSGSQAQTVTSLLLAYGNGYLSAAPGLQVTTAEITPVGNVHASGNAPDTISFQK